MRSNDAENGRVGDANPSSTLLVTAGLTCRGKRYPLSRQRSYSTRANPIQSKAANRVPASHGSFLALQLFSSDHVNLLPPLRLLLFGIVGLPCLIDHVGVDSVGFF